MHVNIKHEMIHDISNGGMHRQTHGNDIYYIFKGTAQEK